MIPPKFAASVRGARCCGQQGARAALMPRWLLWTLLAVLAWGIWALLGKLLGGALSPAHTQVLSTLGLVPVMCALGLSRRLTVTGTRSRGSLLATVAGALTCLGNIAYYGALERGAKVATVIPLTAL